MALIKRGLIGALPDGSFGIEISRAGVNVDTAARSQLLLSTRYGRRAQYLASGKTNNCNPNGTVTITFPDVYPFVPLVDFQRVSISGSDQSYALWSGEEAGTNFISTGNNGVDLTTSSATFRNWSKALSCLFLWTAYRIEAV